MADHLLQRKLDQVLPDTGIPPMWGRWPVADDFNTHNYRGEELTIIPDSRLLVISVGCSWVFGPYLKHSDCFHSIVARRIRNLVGGPVTLWNLGAVGASNDYIARTCTRVAEQYHKQLPILALVSFSVPERREYIDALGELFPFVPSPLKAHIRFPHQKQIDEHFTKLLSTYDDYMQFFRNYKLIEYCFKALNIEWFFTHLPILDEVYHHAENRFLDTDRFVGPFTCVDTGHPDDPGHPGIKSNRMLADAMWQKVFPLVERWAIK